MNMLLFTVHSGWEYELSKIGYQIYRVHNKKRKNPPQPEMMPDNKTLRCPNITEYLFEALEEVVDKCDIIIASNQRHIEYFSNIDKPKYYVVHTLNGVNAVNNLNMDGWHVVYSTKLTYEMGNQKNKSLIYLGVTPEDYLPWSPKTVKNNQILSVAQNFKELGNIYGYDIWNIATQGHARLVLGPNNSDVNDCKKSIYYEPFNFKRALTEHPLYFNPTRLSLMPMTIYDSLAAGIPIVSTATVAIPEVLTHKENAYLSNDPYELRNYIEFLLEDDKERMRLSDNGKCIIHEYFNNKRMIREWKDLLESTFGI